MVKPEQLHPQIFRLAQGGKLASAPVCFPLGLGESGVHEVCETGFGDCGALTGFVLAVSAIQPGVIVWANQHEITREHGHLLGRGQTFLRRDLRPVLSVSARRNTEVLWAVEEVMSSRVGSLVIAEITRIDFTASRRLQLASERTGMPAILILPHTTEGATAASARWRVRSEPSGPNRYDPRAPGAVRWHARIERSRLAPDMVGKGFNVELDDETLSLRVASRLAAHPPATGTTRTTLGHDTGLRGTG